MLSDNHSRIARRALGGLRAVLNASPRPAELRSYLKLLEEEGENPRQVYQELTQKRSQSFPDWEDAPSWAELWGQTRRASQPAEEPSSRRVAIQKVGNSEGEHDGKVSTRPNLFPNAARALGARPTWSKRVHCAVCSVRAERPKLPRSRCYSEGHPLVETPRMSDGPAEKLLIMDSAKRVLLEISK